MCSYLTFWIGDKNQIRKGYENDVILAFANPYVGLSSGYGKGILIDGLVLNADTFNEFTARLFEPDDLLAKVNSMIGQRIKFIGTLENEVILHDTTHGDHEPILAYKHIPLKDAGTERAKKETNRVYWLVESFKVFQIEGSTGSLLTQDDEYVTPLERTFLNLADRCLNIRFTRKEFIRMTLDERRELYYRVGPHIDS